VIADDEGNVIAELSEFLGHRTNNYAEYSGLLACLQWALDHGKRRLRVVSDSELMVKQIQGKYKVNSPDLRPLWEEARRRIGQLERFEISHALRHKNKDADRLANEAMDRGTGHSAVGRGGVPVPLVTGVARPTTAAPAAGVKPTAPAEPAAPGNGQMLRGFTRGGAIHLLGSATLPDGIFVKVIPE
jgi:probable phosphoglycerate mutase